MSSADRSLSCCPESDETIAVEITDAQRRLDVNHEALMRLARVVLAAEGVRRASISVALVDDASIREINRRHLDHDWPTDVISFPLSDAGDPQLCGELVISTETAVSSAREAGVDPWSELALYVSHGLLHLCGYDHGNESGEITMRRREAELLAMEGLSHAFPLPEALAGGARSGDGRVRGGRAE